MELALGVLGSLATVFVQMVPRACHSRKPSR